jgi:riboflavin synthase
MFTGIIEEVGTVKAVTSGAKSSKVTIEARMVLQDVKVGDSISTNGICLTVVAFDPSGFVVDVMPETMRNTGFSQVKPGARVNLERALRLSDRLGGHLVSGHIDGTGKILRRWEEDNAVWFSVAASPEILRYVVNKGSVALDGISLTVASTTPVSFAVSIIPHTQDVTTILHKMTGDVLNIECDVIAKYTEKLLTGKPTGSKIDLNFLAENGF